MTRGGVTLSGTVADEGAADALMLSFAAQLGRDVSRAPSPRSVATRALPPEPNIKPTVPRIIRAG